MARPEGCSCRPSLRAATITLASLNLLYALLEISVTVMEYREAFGDEDYSHESEYEDWETHPAFYALNFIAMVIMVFFCITPVLMLLNVISLSVLIFGAAKNRSWCIKQWLIVGGIVIGNDILSFLVYLALELHVLYAVSPLIDTPLSISLWVVAARCWDRCREMDRRTAEAPRSVSMAFLLEEGDGADSACTVAYRALD